jgi:hypothetical protein
MPLTDAGNQVLEYLKKKHGSKKGVAVFYASINKGVPGSTAWHKTDGKSKSGKSKYSKALAG